MTTKCFECGRRATNDHHVIPVTKGGTKTVPLCDRCHRLAHNFNGDVNARPLGRPPGYPREIEDYAVQLFRQGLGSAEVAARFNAEGIPCLGKRWRGSSFDSIVKRNAHRIWPQKKSKVA